MPWRSVAGLRLLLGAALVLGGNAALAGYVCQDSWGQTYRLPAAPARTGDGLSCTQQAVPPPVLARPGAADARSALALPLPASAPVRAPGAAQPRGRMVLQVEHPLATARAAVAGKGDAGDTRAFDTIINAAASRYGHDARLIKAIVYVESRFNPSAVSPKGALGLMQVMPATALELGVESPRLRLLDPALNLDAGSRYLRRLMDTFADRPELAIAAYNAGEAAVLRHGRRIPPFTETQNYVREVLAQFERLQQRDLALALARPGT